MLRGQVLEPVVRHAARRNEPDVDRPEERPRLVGADVVLVEGDDQLDTALDLLEIGGEPLHHPARALGAPEPEVVELDDDRDVRRDAHVVSGTKPLRLPAHQKTRPAASRPRSAAASAEEPD